jgi:hypothetical protein
MENSIEHANIDRRLRQLPPRNELVRRLALLGLSDALHRDAAFNARVETLRLQLAPTPAEIARIIVEAGEIGWSIRPQA